MTKAYKYFGYFDKETQTYVEISNEELEERRKTARANQAPTIRTDEIEPTESMATERREIFTSLAKLDAHYKEHGFERCSKDELKKKPPKPKRSSPEEIREMAERAYMDIKYDRIEITEKERETCLREERSYQQEAKRRQARWV